MAKGSTPPVLFVSPIRKRQLFCSRRANSRIFNGLYRARAIGGGGEFLGLPEAQERRDFELLASREATKENLQAHLQNEIQAHLAARLPLPPGYRQEELTRVARKLAKSLAPRVSDQLVSGYFKTGRPGRTGWLPQQALARAQSEVQARLTQVFVRTGIPSEIGEFLGKTFSGHAFVGSYVTSKGFRELVFELVKEASLKSIEQASVFDVRVDTGVKDSLQVRCYEVNAFREGEDVYELVPTPAQVERDLDGVSENLIEEVDLRFDLSAYGISRFGDREARETSRWFAQILRKPERAVLHFIAPPLERILYKKWKPKWLRTLEKTRTPVGTRKLIEGMLWGVAKDRILTIPVFVTEDGRRFALFARMRNPKTGKKKTYFTPIAYFVGRFKRRRHDLAGLLGKWAAGKPSSLFRQDFAKILGRHLRRKRKDGKDDKSTTLWWLAKGAGKAVWVVGRAVFRPVTGFVARKLGITSFKALLVDKWYAIETGGGFWSGALKFLRVGRYWGGAFVGGWKGGLGYGFIGYVISGGNPYVALGVGGFGWVGKSISLMASNPEFLALAGQGGVTGWFAGFLSRFALPSLAIEGGVLVETGTFSLFHFPIKGPVIGTGIGWAIGSYFGHPELGGAIGFFTGGVVEYSVVVIPRVVANVIGPTLVSKAPWLTYLKFLKHWPWGIVGGVVSYAVGKYLGLPEPICILMAVGGSLATMLVVAGAGKLLSRFGGWLVSKIPFAGILGRFFGFLGRHWFLMAVGAWRGYQLGVQMGLSPGICALMAAGGAAVGLAVSLSIQQILRLLWFSLARVLWPLVVGLVMGTLPAAILSVKVSLWAVLFNLSSFLGSLAAGAAALLTSATLGAVVLVTFFVIATAVLIAAAFPNMEGWKWQPGPSESRYLRIEKTVDKIANVEPGDILTYSIAVTAKEEDVEVEVLDEIRFAQPYGADWAYYLDECYPGSYPCSVDCSPQNYFCNTAGYTTVSGFDSPTTGEWEFTETIGSQPRQVFKKVLIWEVSLAAGETVEYRYQVRVHPDYEPQGSYSSFCNSAYATTRVGLHYDEAGPAIVCVRGEGGMGSAAVLAHAGAKVDCLEPNGANVYNLYDSDCPALVVAGRDGPIDGNIDNYFEASYYKKVNGQNRNYVTCVNFILEVLTQAGVAPPAGCGDAATWYDAAHEDQRWWTFPNAAWALPQVGVGDIVVFSGGKTGVGHIGVIYYIGSDEMLYYHANTTVPKHGEINFKGGKYHAISSNYSVTGFIHPAQ